MKQTFTYYLYAKVDPDSSEIKFVLSDWKWSKLSETGRTMTFISEHTVEHDMPDINTLTASLVEGLQEKKAEMAAVAQAAMAEIDGQIQSLMALEQIA